MPDQATFLGEPPANEATARAYQADLESDGYVGNLTRLWCWRPDLYESFVTQRQGLMAESALTDRDWAILVTATAAQRGDSYCCLAWGQRLAKLSDDETAAKVLTDTLATSLTDRERALAAWARQVVLDPNATTERDVERLREVGLDDRQIFEATAFVAVRLAWSTINDALGAAPDQELAASAPEAVRAAVSWGPAALVRVVDGVSDPLPDGYRLVGGPPSVGHYLELRERAGLSPKRRDQAAAALPGSWAACHVLHDGDDHAVAMGRLIGDGGWYFHVVDMAVLPEHQRRGLGSAVLHHLLQQVRERAPQGAYVNLLADPPGRPLYARHGFAETAPDAIGMGLALD